MISLPVQSYPASLVDFCKNAIRRMVPAHPELDLPPTEVRSAREKDMEARREIKAERDAAKKEEKLNDYLVTYPPKPMDKYAVGAAFGLVGVLAAKAGLGMYENPLHLLSLPVVLPAAWYMADVGSQFLHKWLDSFASDRNKIWGPMVRAFLVHHEYPKEITKNSAVATIAPVAYGMTVPMVALTAAFSNPEWSAFASLMFTGALFSVESHRQAHLLEKRRNPIWKMLQKYNITITGEDHEKHHKPPHDKEFSTLNNWASPLFRASNFWIKLDNTYWKIFKKMPSNWIADPRSIPPEVVAELTKELDLVPPLLWGVAETLPERIPANLKEPIQQAQVKWRNDYIQRRMDFFKLLANVGNAKEQALKDWEEEQSNPEFQWLYRGEKRPLYDAATPVAENTTTQE